MKFKRILLKLSGEALMGEQNYGIDTNIAESVAKEIKAVHELGVEVAVVVGGGNIFRGVSKSAGTQRPLRFVANATGRRLFPSPHRRRSGPLAGRHEVPT